MQHALDDVFGQFNQWLHLMLMLGSADMPQHFLADLVATSPVFNDLDSNAVRFVGCLLSYKHASSLTGQNMPVNTKIHQALQTAKYQERKDNNHHFIGVLDRGTGVDKSPSCGTPYTSGKRTPSVASAAAMAKCLDYSPLLFIEAALSGALKEAGYDYEIKLNKPTKRKVA